jgi:SprT protein
MVSNEIKKQAETNLKNKINESLNKFKEHGYNIDDFKIPNISFNLKGRVAGKAYYSDNLIKLNHEITNNNKYTEEQITITLYHELGHLITNFLFENEQFNILKDKYGRQLKLLKPHVKEWKKVMKILDSNDSVTHNFEIKTNNSNKIKYLCNCKENNIHWLTKKSHEKNIRMIVSYTCRSCKSKLIQSEN